jgi:16S rRNA (adenine1518-N6/adenine1519-N6)-dimethyltransferase
MKYNTPDYNSPALLRAFLEERGLAPRKMFGQNFLVNPRARDLLLTALNRETGNTSTAGAAAGAVWEIGPGLGAMTAGLLERGCRVTAFEIDKGYCAVLRELFGGSENFTLVEGDVLKTWVTAPRAPCLFGNLPYNISQLLMAEFIEQGLLFRRIVVTVQKEVAARFMAAPLSADYSPISILCSFYYTVTSIATLKGASFYPAPRVDSQALLFTLKNSDASLPSLHHSLLPALLRGLFAQRRKTVANNLSRFLAERGIMGSARRAQEALAAAGIPAKFRAEQIPPEGFVTLAEQINKQMKS